MPERVVADREDVPFVEEGEQPHAGRVLLEDGERVLRPRIALLDAADRRRCENRAPHLGQLDEENTPRLTAQLALPPAAEQPHEQRQEERRRHTDEVVDAPHGRELHLRA